MLFFLSITIIDIYANIPTIENIAPNFKNGVSYLNSIVCAPSSILIPIKA